MSGKLVGIFIVAIAIISGVAIYYLQLYAFYDEAPVDSDLTLVNLVTEVEEVIPIEDFEGIDAASSPLRYRACFTSVMSDIAISETYMAYDDPTPLTAPNWFDCFDAVAIGEALEDGTAMAFLSTRDIREGVDRVIAVFPDGRAFAWHQINPCGVLSINSGATPENCIPEPDGT